VIVSSSARACAGLEAADEEEIVARAALEPLRAGLDHASHHGRDPHLGHEGELRPGEAFRRDAHDSERVAVELHRLSDYGGVGTEAALPAAIAQDRDRMRIRCRIFLRQKRPAEHRFHAEEIEVISGDEIARDALVLAAVTQGADDEGIRGEAFEDGVAIAVILIVEVGLEGDIDAFVHRAEELDEPLRFMHRKRAEEDGVEKPEDGCVRADAERHRDDGERSEAGFTEELANAEADVLEKSFHA
jgi:hypothetical protein